MSSYALSVTPPHDRQHYFYHLHHNHLGSNAPLSATDTRNDDFNNENSNSPGPNYISSDGVDSSYYSNFNNGHHLYHHSLNSRFDHLHQHYSYSHRHPTFFGYQTRPDFSVNHLLDLKRHATAFNQDSDSTNESRVLNTSVSNSLCNNTSTGGGEAKEEAEGEEDEEDDSNSSVDKKPSLLHIDNCSTNPSTTTASNNTCKAHDGNNNKNDNSNNSCEKTTCPNNNFTPKHPSETGMYATGDPEILTQLQGQVSMQHQTPTQHNQYHHHHQHHHHHHHNQQQNGSLHPFTSGLASATPTSTRNTSSYTGQNSPDVTNRSRPSSPSDNKPYDQAGMLSSGYNRNSNTITSPSSSINNSISSIYGPEDDNNGSIIAYFWLTIETIIIPPSLSVLAGTDIGDHAPPSQSVLGLPFTAVVLPLPITRADGKSSLTIVRHLVPSPDMRSQSLGRACTRQVPRMYSR
ncbi:hypothetical protein PoB_001937900 [Plakobranchus ocellatus]|uniref:Uncharacterized protein n=1 Tax=Plakobranchus ocellatus TaxID=259542 RepID=A0AAV3ZG56_9GAST|nr:hypothetical protein PoB_001937900 [Plakobranchus ocellatus]